MMKKVEDSSSLQEFAFRIIGVWDTELTEGAFIAPHSHEDVEEVFYVLDGIGKISVNDKKRRVKKGDLIYIPPKTIHTVSQTGQRPLRLVTVSVSIKGKRSDRVKNYIS